MVVEDILTISCVLGFLISSNLFQGTDRKLADICCGSWISFEGDAYDLPLA